MSFPATTFSADELQKAARDHLWLHFTRMSGFEKDDVPIIVRGEQVVLPRGDEKPSAAHRARLALAEAAGTVLAGGLSLLGIDAPTSM